VLETVEIKKRLRFASPRLEVDKAFTAEEARKSDQIATAGGSEKQRGAILSIASQSRTERWMPRKQPERTPTMGAFLRIRWSVIREDDLAWERYGAAGGMPQFV
jgi:hypothetical protein